MTKKKYLAFLLFSLVLTIVLSGLLITKILKNEASKDIKYINTTINSNNQENQIITSDETTSINIYNKSEETDVDLTYEYKIFIQGIKGTKRYKYNNEEKTLTFDENYEASFTLNINEEITIYDIPVNLEYSVQQNIDKSNQIINNSSTNIFNGITTDENNIEFKNTSSLVTIKQDINIKIIIILIMDFIIIIGLILLRKTKIQKYEID